MCVCVCDVCKGVCVCGGRGGGICVCEDIRVMRVCVEVRFAGEGTVALYVPPNPFLLNKICLNQLIGIFPQNVHTCTLDICGLRGRLSTAQPV